MKDSCVVPSLCIAPLNSTMVIYNSYVKGYELSALVIYRTDSPFFDKYFKLIM